MQAQVRHFCATRTWPSGTLGLKLRSLLRFYAWDLKNDLGIKERKAGLKKSTQNHFPAPRRITNQSWYIFPQPVKNFQSQMSHLPQVTYSSNLTKITRVANGIFFNPQWKCRIINHSCVLEYSLFSFIDGDLPSSISVISTLSCSLVAISPAPAGFQAHTSSFTLCSHMKTAMGKQDLLVQQEKAAGY